MDPVVTLSFYNTLTRRKDALAPLMPGKVRVYACGPTVYDRIHIGNGRMIIVFDVLFRVLRQAYGADNVTYVRNITDIDDKINDRAAELYPTLAPLDAIRKLTTETTERFHRDCAGLFVLPPNVEPRATEHIQGMREICDQLIARGHAYVAADHVLFDVGSMADYGKLSGRSLDEMEAGARVDVAPYKRSAMDFVLWKPSPAGVPGWPSPGGIVVEGRPGWHVECSAMAAAHLGETFDIHGGGIDLVFPHHENEVAQSRCAHGTATMASIWMHNGFLQVEGEKMSKSLGNFVTVHDLLETQTFGGQSWHGRVLRYAMLQAHYRQPIDWTVDRLAQSRSTLAEFAELVAGKTAADAPHPEFLAALSDDLNTPSAMSILHGLAKSARRGGWESAADLKASLQLLGLYDNEQKADFWIGAATPTIDRGQVDALIAARLKARNARDFKESDRLRDELAALGVQLKDAKDPATGELTTTWEVRT